MLLYFNVNPTDQGGLIFHVSVFKILSYKIEMNPHIL